MASPAQVFLQHPLHLDPTSKAISAPNTSYPGLSTELDALNSLHRSILNLDSPNVPPPPRPVNPKRSAQVSKLRDSANTAYRKSAFAEAIRLYGYAIDMAMQRPAWEPLGLVREELAPLYSNRAQAHMSQQQWPEGWVDAQLSIECNDETNTKAWWRGGKCLIEMGRWEEAIDWLQKGLEAEGRGSDGGRELKTLLDDAEKGLEKMGQGV
ncbi:ER protein translocation subcomplex subunit [Coccidioides immitis H538.4]|uniref:ER protein translocation subcomplex subunit n=1 Tax=Coccidioides immitis H538.4 TaxID=396776 RepID=A0A0J8S4C4_COCIT|nr:ER protein translocation subcomplex subunit [Coccidioides immitis H538.4]